MKFLKSFFDNPEEICIGALFGVSTVVITHWLAIPSLIISAIAWRLGGMEGGNKWFRRMGVPVTMCMFVWIASHHSFFSLLPIVAMWGPLAMGYGIPDGDDKGSVLGAFMWDAFNHNEKLANFFTRLVIALIICLTLFPISWISTVGYLVMFLLITVGFPLLTIII